MARIVDTIIAMRILYLLVSPIEGTDAYKFGLIDKDGKTVRKAKTDDEQNSTSPLHRMIWNLKRLIGLVPGGNTKIGSLTAGFLLMKEAVENDWSESELTENFIEKYKNLLESDYDSRNIEYLMDKLDKIIQEDSPVNASGPGVSTDTPKIKIGPMQRRKKFMQIEVKE